MELKLSYRNKKKEGGSVLYLAREARRAGEVEDWPKSDLLEMNHFLSICLSLVKHCLKVSVSDMDTLF